MLIRFGLLQLCHTWLDLAGSGIILLCASVAVSNRIYFSFETLSDQNHVKRINYNRIIVALDLIRFHVNVALNSDKIAWRNSACHTTFHFSNYALCNARYKTGFFKKNLQIIIIMKAVHQFSFLKNCVHGRTKQDSKSRFKSRKHFSTFFP